MRALGFTEAGGPEVLQIVDVPAPRPRHGQVRIRVHYAALSPTDVSKRDPANISAFTREPPWVVGMDAAGVIDEAPGVTDLAPGDEVIAMVVPRRSRLGAQAEYVVVPRESVARVPSGMSLTEASTLPMNSMTAHYALTVLELPAGSTVAVSGGAGFLGSLVTQLAKSRGYVVFADAAEKDVETVKANGATHVVPRSDDFGAAVRAVAPEGVDAVVDTAVIGEKVLSAVKDGGQVVSVRAWQGPPSERGIRIHAILVGDYAKNQQAMQEVSDLAAAGVLRPRVAGVYELEQAQDAYRRFESGGVRGRLVLRLAP